MEAKGKVTTWICNSVPHTCANVDLDEAGRGEWNHTEPFNDCVVKLPFVKGDEHGAGMLKQCLWCDEQVMFRILKVENAACCPACNATFTKGTIMRNLCWHVFSAHGLYLCMECMQTFDSKCKRGAHERFEHPKGKAKQP